MNMIRLQSTLKLGTIPCALKRDRNGWHLRLPARIDLNGGIEKLSDVKLLDYPGMTKMRCRMESVGRYLAQAYPDSEVVYISPRMAMKNPKWAGRFGALPELAHAAMRAGLVD